MKKRLLFAFGSMLLCGVLHAGSLTFINSTGYPKFIGQLQGRNSAGTPAGEFVVGDILVQPGTTVYPNPTTVTGMASYVLPTGFFTGMIGYCMPVFVGVGSATFSTMPQTQIVPAGNDCNNGLAFNIYWNQGGFPNYDVVVLLLP